MSVRACKHRKEFVDYFIACPVGDRSSVFRSEEREDSRARSFMFLAIEQHYDCNLQAHLMCIEGRQDFMCRHVMDEIEDVVQD